MKRLLITVILALASSFAAAQPSTDDELYRAFGGKPGLASLMQDFVRRLVVDPRTAPSFRSANLPRLEMRLTEQLCMIAGGPCQYTGRDMKSAHAGMAIGKAEFNALVEVLQEAMNAKRIAFSAQNRMLARLAHMHRDIIAN